MKLKEIFRLTGIILFLILMTAGLILFIMYEKGEILLGINSIHSSFLDVFFKYWTYLGDGWIFLFVFVFFILSNYYFALLTTLAVIIQTILVQGMKKIVFNDIVRPKLFFENFPDLHVVNGVDIHSYNAFPSGHTATAFTVAFLFSLYSKNRSLSVLFFTGAFLVGLSRIYLLQHFYIDTYFGAIVGVLSVFLSYVFLENMGLREKFPWKGSLLKRAGKFK